MPTMIQRKLSEKISYFEHKFQENHVYPHAYELESIFNRSKITIWSLFEKKKTKIYD